MADDQERGRRRPYSRNSDDSDEGRKRAEEPSAKFYKCHSDGSDPSRIPPKASSDAQPSSSRGRSFVPNEPRAEYPSTSHMSRGPPPPPGTSGSGQMDAPAAGVRPTGTGSESGGPQGNRRQTDRYDIVRTRPADVVTKQGKDGRPIMLKANFFGLKTMPQWRIVHYHVDISPDIESIRLRLGILSEHAKLLSAGYLYDGKQLFMTKVLESEVTVLKGQLKTGGDYTITIKFVGFISTVEPRFLQVLNLILRRSMKGLKLELVGRNLFDPMAKIPIHQHHMELWPGYETSIRQHEKDILLCAEITHKVMRTETVYDILRRSSQNPSRHQEEFRSNVLGLVVLTDYNNKTYRVNDVDFSQTPNSTFSCKGKDVSFVEYYQMKYNIRIRDHGQPLLISKNKDKAQKTNASDIVVLIPELCRVTGLTENMRSNFQLMRAMSDYTRMKPNRRIERLTVFNHRLQGTHESVKVLTDWNMRLEEKLVEVKGRIIDPQKIVFNQKRKCLPDDNADWTKHFRDHQMLTTPSDGLSRWVAIVPRRNGRDLNTLLSNLVRAASGMGLRIRDPTVLEIYDDRTASYVKEMNSCTNLDPKLILCLVPNNNVERYSSIKKIGCIDKGIPTQVVTSKTVSNRSLMSIATKIAVQLNCKMGYTPWMIELPLSGLMTLGFDIAKSSRDRSKAFGALVASMDLQENSTYFSTVAECSAYDVLANHLWPMMAKALRQYQREHKILPKRILFYRDGVSAGSLQQLFEYEVKDIVEKLDNEYKRANLPPPMMAYITVSRSSKTRFFNRESNPPPGTVVDDVVTLPERYDFYLVSQTVRQGTVSPTSYNVLYSNINLTPDQLQKLTYKMCHLYYNWSGTTRVPAVCQYAKKLATLVGTNLHTIPQSALEKKFYYL